MKRRKSLTRKEQIQTLQQWMKDNGMSQRRFALWLDQKGVVITPQYLNDVLTLRKPPGPKFIQVFKEITGIKLIPALVQQDSEHERPKSKDGE